jgi:uncharacterized protein (UPF0335 family)
MPRKPKLISAPTLAGPGHNGLDRDKLRRLLEREALEEGPHRSDIRRFYAEAWLAEFRALREVIRLPGRPAERDARQATIDVYLHALADLADPPLGRGAIERRLVPPVSDDEV